MLTQVKHSHNVNAYKLASCQIIIPSKSILASCGSVTCVFFLIIKIIVRYFQVLLSQTMEEDGRAHFSTTECTL